MVGPVAYLLITQPQLVGQWLAYKGDASGGVQLSDIMLGAGVAFVIDGADR